MKETKEKIFLFGASEHTRNTIDVIELQEQYLVAGIFDFELEKGVTYGGYPVLGADNELVAISKKLGITKGIVTIGDNYLRKKVVTNIQTNVPTFEFVSAIHPSAILGKNVTIGKGSVLMAGVIINNDSTVGDHAYIGTKSSLDHDASFGDFSSISPGATTGGNVTIGSCTAIGLGANIIHGRTIGDHTVIGAGALVVKDISSHVVAYGIPTKKIRDRIEGDKYL